MARSIAVTLFREVARSHCRHRPTTRQLSGADRPFQATVVTGEVDPEGKITLHRSNAEAVRVTLGSRNPGSETTRERPIPRGSTSRAQTTRADLSSAPVWDDPWSP
jgi:hypothetical protein